MSYARNIEPKLLSIEAIIKKGELKNKVLNSIPIDFKKLFLEQMAKACKNKNERIKASNITEEIYCTLSDKDQINFVNKDTNSFTLSKNPRPFSLNSTKCNKNLESIQSLQTTRTSKEQKQKISKSKHRHSVGQIVKIQKLKQLNTLQNQNKNIQNFETKAIQTTYPKIEMKTNKYKRVQFQLIMPAKQSKSQGFRKVANINKQCSNNLKQQKQSDHSNHLINQISKTQQQQNAANSQKQIAVKTLIADEARSKTSNAPRSKKIHSIQQPIPDFVMAAVQKESKKISPVKPYKMEACKIFEDIEDDKMEQQRSKSMKLPSCVVQMKKKVNFYRARKSQQSCEDLLQPKAQFLKLVEKQRGIQLMKKVQQNNKKQKVKSRQKIPNFKNVTKKLKFQKQQQLNGWQIKDNQPQLYDYY